MVGLFDVRHLAWRILDGFPDEMLRSGLTVAGDLRRFWEFWVVAQSSETPKFESGSRVARRP